MNYTHLTLENKVAIKTLRNEGYSIRMIACKLGIPKSTVHRPLSTPKDKVQKTSINIEKKYTKFLDYLRKNHDWKTSSVELCVHRFKMFHKFDRSVSVKQVYNRINSGKLDLGKLCYKNIIKKRSTQWWIIYTETLRTKPLSHFHCVRSQLKSEMKLVTWKLI